MLRIRGLVPLAVAGVALAGCGSSTPTVSRADLEHGIARTLGAKFHRAPPNISCPGGLPRKVGATVHCVLSVTGQPQRYRVTVRVTSISGSHVNYHIAVGTSPLPAGSG